MVPSLSSSRLATFPYVHTWYIHNKKWSGDFGGHGIALCPPRTLPKNAVIDCITNNVRRSSDEAPRDIRVHKSIYIKM
jgi:hypothetical protein